MTTTGGEAFVPRNRDSAGILARAARYYGVDGLRVDTGKLRPDRHDAVVRWVRSLGVDPNDVRSTFVIRSGLDQYELHLSRYVRDEQGEMILDRAADDVVSEPLVISIGTEKSWPDLTEGTQ